MPAQIKEVQRFWDEHPCGSSASAKTDRRAYFREARKSRYTSEWHIPVIARFPDTAGKRVLEIGCGIGSDGVEFALARADYVGTDLSRASLELARENFALEGVAGNFVHVNAERLPFHDASFDHVYSFGVIHHSPDPSSIVREIRRVLVPGGTCTVMLYNETSLNYLVQIAFLRRIARLLLSLQGSERILSRLTGIESRKLARHREILISRGRITKEQWISINTDGPDCPLSRVYNGAQAKALFRGFVDVETEVWYFNRAHWPLLGPRLPERLVRAIGRRFGWHRMVHARTPDRDGIRSGHG